MHNFRITSKGQIRRREGYRELCTLPDGVSGFCYGSLETDKAPMLYYCLHDRICAYDFETHTHLSLAPLSRIYPDSAVTMFFFRRALYILDGKEYYVYDGQSCETVEGYIPLHYTDVTPFNGEGVEYEEVNALTRCVRALYSPTERTSAFLLPERAAEIIWVKVYGKIVLYTVVAGLHDDLRLQINLDTPVEADVRSVEICYRLEGEGRRAQILSNTKVYPYGGSDDLRLFFYGNPDGRIDYSVPLSQSVQAAEYFPLNGYITVGSGNTPVSAMVRRYDHLIVHTPTQTYSLQRSANTYRTYLVHESIGHTGRTDAFLMGQDSCAICNKGMYRLKTTAMWGDRAMERICDRIERALPPDAIAQCIGFHNERHHEIWLASTHGLWVYQYEQDAWYTFDNPEADGFVDLDGVGFYRGNTFYRYEQDCDTDCGNPIYAVLQSAPFLYAKKRTSLSEVGLLAYGDTPFACVRALVRTSDCEEGNDPCFAVSPHPCQKWLTFAAKPSGTPAVPTHLHCDLGAGTYASVRLETQDDVTISYLELLASGQGRHSSKKENCK